MAPESKTAVVDVNPIKDIMKDIPSMGYLSFTIVNTCAFFMIVGFFTGTGALHGSITKCTDMLEAGMNEEHATAVHHLEDLQQAYACLEETEQFVKSDGHYHQILVPVLIVAVANVFIFGVLFYIRGVRNFRWLDPLRKQKEANSLPMQQDGEGFDESQNVYPDAGLTPDAKTIGVGTPPEAASAGTPPEAGAVVVGAPQQV
jgi:hypothetical protein